MCSTFTPRSTTKGVNVTFTAGPRDFAPPTGMFIHRHWQKERYQKNTIAADPRIKYKKTDTPRALGADHNRQSPESTRVRGTQAEVAAGAKCMND